MSPLGARFIRRFSHILGIDRAVAFTVMARTWSILSGLITIVLIARFLSPAEQGYYYTFSSLVALQTVFELGFSFVILQLAAHERAQLEIENGEMITGSEIAHSRLASVLQKAVRWYSVAAILMAMGLLFAGFHFFASHQSSSRIAWKLPWICVTLATTVTFQLDPVFSFLEGCGFVPQVARLRFGQAATGSILAWSAFALHHGLYAPAAVISGQAIAGIAFLLSKWHLLWPLLKRKTFGNIVGWRTEIWPFQWRIAISWMCGYFIFPLFNPVLFALRGPAEAGRMGMSVSIATALGTVAYAWINTKAAPFGGMIARRDFSTLDQVFFRALRQSCLLLAGGMTLTLISISVIEMHFPQITTRILPIPIFAILAITVFLNHIMISEAAYLRAHKQEPLLLQAIAVAVLTGTSTVIAGKLWGATGVTIGYFFCGGAFNLISGTYVFIRRRREWHAETQGVPAIVRYP